LESSTEVKWLGIKPYIFRIFSGFIALWSANQVIYLILATGTALPNMATGSRFLAYPAQEPSHIASIIFHSIAVVMFGIGTVIPSRTLMRAEEWWEVHRERPTWIAGVFLYVVFALAILGYYWVSITAPRYLTYIDPGAASVVKRQTHLLRPGVAHETIPFGDINEIVFDFDPSISGNDSFLYLAVDGVGEVEVGRFTLEFSEEDLVELGKTISQYSSVAFEEPDLPELPR
jgi:hypothetical protein